MYYVYSSEKYQDAPRSCDTALTDKTDQWTSSLCDVGREHETSNCSAAAQCAVALTAVHVDDVPESDAVVRQLSFYGHTAVQIMFCAFQDAYAK